MISVSLNNDPFELTDGRQLNDLLARYQPEGAFAVAVNGEFVPKSRYGEVALEEGDEVDIVSPVGGG